MIKLRVLLFVAFWSASVHFLTEAKKKGKKFLLKKAKKFIVTGDKEKIKVKKISVTERDSNVHLHVKKVYDGLDVIGGDIVINMNSKYELLDIMKPNNTSDEISLKSTIPTLSTQEALIAAQKEVGGKKYSDTSKRTRKKVDLIVYARSTTTPVLAYQVQLSGTCSDGSPADLQIIVDATSGDVIAKWNEVRSLLPACESLVLASKKNVEFDLNQDLVSDVPPESGTGIGVHNGPVFFTSERIGFSYYLMDFTRGRNTVVNNDNGLIYFDLDNNDFTSAEQAPGVDVHFGNQETWDYFDQSFGRLGPNNNGEGYLSFTQSNSDNAFFTTLCFCYSYGDGADKFQSLTSLDTVAGQNAQGLIFFTASLLNSGESGAISVSTSDIFATVVEHFAQNAQDPPDYFIGEEVVLPPQVFLRSMIQPSDDGFSADCYFLGIEFLDIHYAAGVGNHFFFLLAEGTKNGVPSKTCAPGDTFNATLPGTVQGIGIEKASAIWYHALVNYFTPDTRYDFAYLSTSRAAADLYGSNSIEASAVLNSWFAVGLFSN